MAVVLRASAGNLEFCVARQSSVGKLLHYLDDFLFGGKKGTNHFACIMSVFQGKMTLLGVPIAYEKTEGKYDKNLLLGLGDRFRRNGCSHSDA